MGGRGSSRRQHFILPNWSGRKNNKYKSNSRKSGILSLERDSRLERALFVSFYFPSLFLVTHACTVENNRGPITPTNLI